MKVQAIFHDGAVYEAPSFAALEDTLMEDAWNPSIPDKFRAEMANRALVWSGWHLDKEASSEMFLRGMEAAGMMRLEVEK